MSRGRYQSDVSLPCSAKRILFTLITPSNTFWTAVVPLQPIQHRPHIHHQKLAQKCSFDHQKTQSCTSQILFDFLFHIPEDIWWILSGNLHTVLLNYIPHQVSWFTNVSSTSLSGTLLAHSTATMRTRAGSIFMVLTVNIFINHDSKLAVELLGKTKIATLVTSFIVILIPPWAKYGLLLSMLFSLLSFHPNLPSFSSSPHDSMLSLRLSIISTVSIILVGLPREDLLYACLICTLKC